MPVSYTHLEVYFYPWLTESNLPYIFALKGMQHQNILGQKFLIGTQLYNCLLYTSFDDETNITVFESKQGIEYGNYEMYQGEKYSPNELRCV